MAEPAKKGATYGDLYSIPENMTGEIIAGDLYVSPRPSRKHTNAASTLGSELIPAYRFGRGGPGGWIIIIEPEVGLEEDILVPDLAGWKIDRFPAEEQHNWISIAPDWVCELLSPGTIWQDKIKKMPLYARHGVRHLWLIDPLQKTLDVYRLESGKWLTLGVHGENEKVRAEPFQEVEIDLNHLWLELPGSGEVGSQR